MKQVYVLYEVVHTVTSGIEWNNNFNHWVFECKEDAIKRAKEYAAHVVKETHLDTTYAQDLSRFDTFEESQYVTLGTRTRKGGFPEKEHTDTVSLWIETITYYEKGET